MIPPETRVQIRRYFYAEHWKIGTIAQALNVHPDTVRRAIEVERFQHAEPLRPSVTCVVDFPSKVIWPISLPTSCRMPPNVPPSICPSCGATNNCAATRGAPIEQCWCWRSDVRLPLPADTALGCYCAACLQRLTAPTENEDSL